MDKLMEGLPKPAAARKTNMFKLYTDETFANTTKRITEDLLLRQAEEADGQEKPDKAVPKKKPNPGLMAGKQFPDKLGDFPPEMYGQPIEDLDEYYSNKYVSQIMNNYV